MAFAGGPAEEEEMHNGQEGLVGLVCQVGKTVLTRPTDLPDLPGLRYCWVVVFGWFARKPVICFTA